MSLSDAAPIQLAPAPQFPAHFGSAADLRFTLEALGHALPQGVMILDGDLRIVFSNAEAAQMVALWRGGRAGAARYKPSAWLAVPGEIAQACAELWNGRPAGEARPFPGRGPKAERRCQVRHPCRPSLWAVVSLYRSSSDPSAVRFCVLLREGPGAPASATSAPAWPGLALLTPAERRVAALVAEGRGNREIALELGRCPTTVKCQLGSVFRKLGVGTRTQLALAVRGFPAEKSLG